MTTESSVPFWEGLIKIAAGGFSAGGGIMFVRWFIVWLTGRHDRREAILNAQAQAIDERWASYTKRIEARCSALEERLARSEHDVEECHRGKRELEDRVARLEGFDHGAGDRRNLEQLARAVERQVTRRADLERGDENG